MKQRPCSILVVDDDPSIATLLETYVTSLGIELVRAESAHTAFKCLDESVPNLILLDIQMPEMNGYEFLKILRNTPKHAELPVLMLTGHSEKENVKRAVDLGIEGYVVKPFDKDLVLSKITQALEDVVDQQRVDFPLGSLVSKAALRIPITLQNVSKRLIQFESSRAFDVGSVFEADGDFFSQIAESTVQIKILDCTETQDGNFLIHGGLESVSQSKILEFKDRIHAKRKNPKL